MKRFPMMAVAALLVTGANVAMASSGSLTEFKPRYLPVLVQVNAKGQVTDASPAVELSPVINRLMRKNLDEMIAKPATYKGRAVSSQFVINLALQVTPRSEGDYVARFGYVSTSPVPNGSWYWVNINGHRLALANRDDFGRGQRLFYNHDHGIYRPVNQRAYSNAPTPSFQNAARPASAPSAPFARGH
ncbi:hypothetical protein [Rhodanobacter sp. L36]|uniref:hypothetical protein n=1 Tax=Rhodanobacter sp. L36 TaxID=1747221 RepID=UPI00131B0213|nr:hypothetical protein [Rhodanobacter sp. L36]